MKNDRLYLSNIKECIEQIDFYTVDGKDVFLQRRMIQDAVIRNFEIIGEATKRLSVGLKTAHPEIQWQQIAGFRDVLIHDYLKINLHRVWGTIERDLPRLKQTVEEIMQEL